MTEKQTPSYKELERRLAIAEAALQALREGQVDTDLGEQEALVLQLAEAQAREAHIKQVLLAIRNVNQLIVHETDPQRLIERACANLAKTLGYHNTWISLIDETGAVTMTASSGFNDAFEVMRDRLERGDYPACMRRTFEQDRLVVIKDLPTECPDCPLAHKYAGRARLIHRLAFKGHVYGTLSVSVPPAYAHDAEEQALFEELAGDLAFALYKIEVEQRRQAAEKEIVDTLESISDAFFALDDDMVVTYFNRAAERQLGRSADEVVGRPLFDAFPEARGSIFEEKYSAAIRTQEPTTFETYFDVPPYQNWYDVRVYPRENGISVYFLVTTERVQAEEELNRRAENLRTINELAINLTHAQPSADYVKLIADELKDITNALAVSVSVYEPEEQALIVKYVAAGGRIISRVNELLNRQIVGFSTPVSAEHYDQMVREIVRKAPDLHEVTFGAIPKPVSAVIQKLLGIDHFIGLAFTEGDELIGTSVIVIPSGQVSPSNEVVETFARVAAASLRQRKAEEALRKSEEKYRLLADNTLDVIWTMNLDLEFTYVNPAITQLTGHTPEEWIGSRLADHCEEAPFTKMAGVIAQEVAKGPDHKGVVFETELLHKDGSPLPVEIHGSVIFDTDGNPISLQGTTRDISERVRAEQERELLLTQIRDQARQMEQVLATVPAGVLLLDAEGRVLQTNPVAEKELAALAGARVGDVVNNLGGRPLAELLTSPPTRGLWHEVEANGRTFEIIARPTESGPEAEHWVMVINDVTQEREIRAQLQQQERLAAVGQLAAGVAHDFNNIMASIVLYAQMAARSQEFSERNQERMAVITQQAWHASRLIEQILDFSRRAVLERQALDLLPLLKEQVKLLERTLPEHIAIELNYERDEYTVHADPTRMQQMLTNLAVNARDAMLDGGTLRIELARMTHDRAFEEGSVISWPNDQEAQVGEWIRLTVSDTGTGIAPDALPHIFEPFFTTKGPGEGSGLGLAQVYGIVGQHGGHIGLETEVGVGTTFTIYLPALEVGPTELSLQDVSAIPQGRGQLVLVVEDDVVLRTGLVESLETLSYQALEAANGERALETMQQQGEQVALVLSDVVMPGMGGMALFHALRDSGWQTPVILLTGHPMEEELEALQDRGLNAWLLKPPTFEQLARAVADALREPPGQG